LARGAGFFWAGRAPGIHLGWRRRSARRCKLLLNPKKTTTHWGKSTNLPPNYADDMRHIEYIAEIVRNGTFRLNQPESLQTRMPVPADDDVVVQRNAERLGDLLNLLRHLDVGARRRRVA